MGKTRNSQLDCPSAPSTLLFAPITRNFDTTGPIEDVYDFSAQLFAEGKDLVESQRPQVLPLELRRKGTSSRTDLPAATVGFSKAWA